MKHEPGKYDSACSMVRSMTAAQGVAVIVMGGYQGSGFSVQMTPDDMGRLPDMLEMMARGIRHDLGLPEVSNIPAEVLQRAKTSMDAAGLTIEDLNKFKQDVKAAVIEYYDDLVARKHGGVAQDSAFKKIEALLGTNFDTYRNQKG